MSQQPRENKRNLSHQPRNRSIPDLEKRAGGRTANAASSKGASDRPAFGKTAHQGSYTP